MNKDELYTTYEDYQNIVEISMSLNSNNEKLEQQLKQLQQEKQELIDWLENLVDTRNQILDMGDKDMQPTYEFFAYQNVLNKIKGSDTSE